MMYDQFYQAAQQRYCQLSKQIDADSFRDVCGFFKPNSSAYWTYDSLPCIVQPENKPCDWIRTTLDVKATPAMFNNHTGTKTSRRASPHDKIPEVRRDICSQNTSFYK